MARSVRARRVPQHHLSPESSSAPASGATGRLRVVVGSMVAGFDRPGPNERTASAAACLRSSPKASCQVMKESLVSWGGRRWRLRATHGCGPSVLTNLEEPKMMVRRPGHEHDTAAIVGSMRA